MTAAGLLLASVVAVPLLLAAALGRPGARGRALDLLLLAPLPGLAAALFAPEGALVLAPGPLRLTLALDMPGALLLGGAALLWLLAGAYARTYLADDPRSARFAFWWLLTLAGSLGTFLVADLASFYLVFSLASLSAYGLVAHERSARSGRAAFVYMALAILGEAFLLLAFVMLASGGEGNPLISEAVARLPALPEQGAVLALLILGFGLKMGLVPLHVWMPLAHPVAPMPASAVLSGIIVKAGVIGLIRFLPFDAGAPGWGGALVALGLVTAFYGVAVGLTQKHPKVVLAYSTVSQMGSVAVILGAGLATASPLAGAFAAFYALHHLLVKGALFLGVGIAGVRAGRRAVIAAMVVLALALAGLPLTSGALAKYAAKDLIGDGVAGTLAALAGAGSALLMLHFLRRFNAFADTHPEPPHAGLVVPWVLAALASLLVPWTLMASATDISPLATLGPGALWASIWPILLGFGLAVLGAWVTRRYGWRLPPVPEGDIIALAAGTGPLAERVAGAAERADAALCRWPVGAAALTAIGLALAAALQWGR